MNYTDEMIAKAKTAASASELQAMAKEYNIELTDTEAAEYFDFLHGNHKVNKDGLQELSSVELEMVAGGKGAKDPYPKYQAGQHLWKYWGYRNNGKHYCEYIIIQPNFYNKTGGYWYYRALDVDANYEYELFAPEDEEYYTYDPSGQII